MGLTIKHWEHVELLSREDYIAFTELGRVLKPSITDLLSNTAVIVKNGDTGEYSEGIYDTHKSVRGIRKLNAPPHPETPNRDLRLYIDAINNPNITYIAVDGLMGTGKTSTIVRYACDELSKCPVPKMGFYVKDKPERRVVVAKPYVNADGENYGFLKGNIDEKLDPTLQNFIQYFDRYHTAGYDRLKEIGFVEILPLGHIRGWDADGVIVIADECQNTSHLYTLATRKASKCRMIFLGDSSPFQIDKKGNTPKKNGLTDFISLMEGAPYFQHIEMRTIQHIVRSDEVKDIVRRLFTKYGENFQELVNPHSP